MTQDDRTERFVVVGDLHLDPDPMRRGRITAEAADVAFHNFVDTLTADAGRAAQRHLVLLGDVIDFDRVRHAGRRDEPSARLAVDHLEATHAAFNAGAERRRRQRYRDGDLALYARGIGLRTDAAAALDRLGQVEPLRMLRRLAGTALHRGPDTRGQELMRRGARRLDALLNQFGSNAPLLMLAHSHVAEIVALRGGRWYANPGRWAPDLEGAYPYLEVEWDERSVTVTLLAWDDAKRQRRRISVGRPILGSEPGLS